MNAQPITKQGRGTVLVLSHVCKGCSYCIDFCPSNCLEFSKEFNAKGYHFPVLVRPEDCTGCNLCGLYCPDFAIFGVKLKDLGRLADGSARVRPGPSLAEADTLSPAA